MNPNTDKTRPPRLLGRAIEIHLSTLAPTPVRHAVLDFDGTLSLLRAGWQEIMVAQCLETLAHLPNRQAEIDLKAYCRAFIDRLTGKPTIEQMRQLAKEVRQRGGTPQKATQYKRDFLHRLTAHLTPRKSALRQGTHSPKDYLVAGSLKLLEGLAHRGATCHLASGTDHEAVVEETALLGLAPYFADRIYGARPGPDFRSKASLITALVQQTAPGAVAVFGDGADEIGNGVAVGATTVAAATAEAPPYGWDPAKKNQLRRLGAHILVPDWREADLLLPLIFGESS